MKSVLDSLEINEAQGPDAINGAVLKNCSKSLSYPLHKLFILAYNTGYLPSEWKLANVVPIHKKDDKSKVVNFRPISLTSLVMKVFERILYDELYSRTHEKIGPRQQGFLKNKSCNSNLLTFIEFIARSLHEKIGTDVIYFDFAKAFDTVSHDLVLQKLKAQYKIDGTLLKFFVNYLQGRKQQVIIDNAVSNSVNCYLEYLKAHQMLGFINKAHQMLGFTKRTCHFISDIRKRRSLYLSLVRSNFEHASIIWRPTTETAINEFEQLQKKALKWILNEENLHYDDEANVKKCYQTHLSPMKVFFDINDLTYFHKIINNQIPLNIPEYIKPYTGQSRLRQTNLDDMSYVCTYNSSSFPSCRSPFYKSFFYRVVHTWNSIPLFIRNIPNIQSFKHKAISHYFALYDLL